MSEITPGRYVSTEYYEDFSTGKAYTTSQGTPLLKYQVVIDVKVTEKSYIFNLVDFIENHGYAPQIADMFRDNKRVAIRRDKPSKHAIHTWSGNSFTLYPYRVGVPYVFNKEE